MQSAELLLFGPALALFSLAASYLDFKTHKIPNALVLRVLAVSSALNAFYFVTRGLSGLFFFFGFVAASAAISTVLYLVDFWKPGDVKFYTALSTMVHPTEASQLLLPLLGFIVLSIAATIAEAVFTRRFKFRPEPKAGMLLPVVLAPLVSLMGISSLPAIFIMLFLGSKLEKFRTPIVAAAAVVFVIFPYEAFKALAITAAFFMVSSLRFEGRLPSAPFISASFIYLVAVGRI